jgi:hypothetical protein
LRVARAQLDSEIGERVQLGQELLDRHAQTMADVEQLEDEFQTWAEFNEQLFRARFTTAKVADEYRRVTLGAFGRGNPQQELRWLRQGIGGQMRKLDSIRGNCHSMKLRLTRPPRMARRDLYWVPRYL